MQVPAIKVRAAGTHHRFRVLRSAFIIFAVLMVSMLLGAGQLWAQCGSLKAPSTTWQNGGNSFWNLDGNWTSGTPTATTNACILNGTSIVTLDAMGNVLGPADCHRQYSDYLRRRPSWTILVAMSSTKGRSD